MRMKLQRKCPQWYGGPKICHPKDVYSLIWICSWVFNAHHYSDIPQESLLLTQRYLVCEYVYFCSLICGGSRLHFFVFVENKEKIKVLPWSHTVWKRNNMSKTTHQFIKSEPTGGSSCPKAEVSTTQNPLELMATLETILVFHSPGNGVQINPF